MNEGALGPQWEPARWRLLSAGTYDGATNMAVDEAIMRAVTEKLAPPTLRFYGWEPPCISLGYSQSLREIDQERCRRDGIQWVRRPTGGRAILHTNELTYSLVTTLDDPRAVGGVVESYQQLSRGLVAGLVGLHLSVAQAQYQDGLKKDGLSAACFDVPSHYEVTVAGRKLVGSAQVRRRGVLLQHGTLPLYGDIARLADYLAFSSEEEREDVRGKLAARGITLEAAMGRRVSFEEVTRAMAAGFADALRLQLVAGELTPQEWRWVEEFIAGRYGNSSWIGQR